MTTQDKLIELIGMSIEQIADERDKLRAEVERLRVALRQACDDLEGYIDHHYPVSEYPDQMRRREREAKILAGYREALGEGE